MHAKLVERDCIIDIEIFNENVLRVTNKRAQGKNSIFISSHSSLSVYLLSQIFPMMRNCAILLLCVLHIASAKDELTVEIESDELMKTSDLEQAETKDASATEIIKQIRKLNPDGTFTIGFEAVSDFFV